MSETHKALDYSAQALVLMRATGDRRGEATALSILGGIYLVFGERQKCLDYQNQARLLRQAAGDRAGEAAILTNIGESYNLMGERQKAVEYESRALLLARETGDRAVEVFTLLVLGGTYNSLGESEKALGFYNQALPLARITGGRRGEAWALHNMGWSYELLGDWPRALTYFSQAMPIMQEIGERTGEAYTLRHIGKVHDLLGDKQEAQSYYKRALTLLRAIGDRRVEAETLSEVANFERGRDNLIEARADIESAIEIIESQRMRIGSQELRASYMAIGHQYYEFYIALLSQLHQRNPSEGYDATALQVSERARARSLLDLLTEAHADIRQGVDAALLERERNLQQVITIKADRRIRLLNTRHTDQQAAEASKELETLDSEYQEVEAKIRTVSPRYAALTHPQTLTLSEIQHLLDEDTMLLEYALGHAHSYLWAVTPGSIKSFELDSESVINAAAQRVYELLTARTKKLGNETPRRREARISRADADYHAAAAELSRLLLAPVASQLGSKRLVIVGDGALQYIPFAALPVPGSTRREDSETPGERANRGVAHTPPRRIPDTPLIVEHEMVNLPSASTLASLRRDLEGRKQPTKTVAVFADPVFEATDRRVIQKSRPINNSPENSGDKAISNAARNRGDEKTGDEDGKSKAIRDYLLRTRMIEEGQPLARLPYSRKEAMAIASLVPKGQRKIALNFDVNYQTATSAELGEYRFVHFATHGLLDTDQPELSGMLLSLVDNEGRPQENGILRLGDVYNLKLPVDMVALSGCETALGKSIRGEGLVGLTRGFMYAGAPRVLSSLWKVEEAATAELMKTFYEGVLGAQQGRPADALRRAQIEMWRKPRHRAPYYWGAFVLQGEWR